MADARRYGIGAQLDIEQILLEAQHRWLRPAEICEILRNYKKFQIASEPANRPPSGSLFLFDRKVLRYFRKDGHNWRKKKDGKTVKEAHERLKAGSIDVLHCYYAHGEEDENFQRRSYWMLEEELSHIVLVHYREVKGNRTNFNRIKETEEASPVCLQAEENVTNSEVDSSVSSKFHPSGCQGTSQTTDTTGFSSAQASEYEDAESACNNQASSTFNSLLELQTPGVNKLDAGIAAPYYPAPLSDDYQGKYPAISEMDLLTFSQGDRGKNSYDAGLTYQLMKSVDFLVWDNVLENSAAGIQSTTFKPSRSSTQIDSASIMPQQVYDPLLQANANGIDQVQESGSCPDGQDHWKVPHGDSSDIRKWSVEQKCHANLANNLNSGFPDGEISSVDSLNSLEPAFPTGQYMHPPQNVPVKLANVEAGSSLKSVLQSNLATDGITDYSALKQPVLDGISKEGLKKLDSFDRWMSKELGDVNEPHMQSTSGSYWETMGNEDGVDDSDIGSQVHLDAYMLSPSLSQDQLFSIIDFSPSWAYSESEIKVLITGRFLKSQQDSEKFKWACMFGEVEVPAEVLADGVLRCYTPLHKAGRVPFYVTCSNRLACSEVREFEFRANEIPDVNIANIPSGSSIEAVLHMRFVKLLSLESSGPQVSVSSSLGDHAHLISKINSLLKEDHNEWEKMLKFTSQGEFSAERAREQLLSKLLKERLREWLLQKIAEGGKGPCVLDEEGQGVLHFAAALGYDWAISPTVVAGVSVNFRDVNGWTALHWAASRGRERTVAFLISLGAAPGALTDPTQYSSGRTPADLASSSGHKGIAGYLAESSLSSHLQLLELKEIKEGNDGEIARVKPVQTVSERAATAYGVGDLPLKDSLAAVCNATQAAARIHQVFRVQSFQMRQVKEYGGSGLGMSDEYALSLLAVKTNNAGQHDEPVHAAAIRIQNKFRSWKGRKEFLTIREHIVKIQAHVRGHQVRKNYKKIIWSVGILDKVILRWRRKGTGLRGFKSEALTEGTSMQVAPPKEDDYDFLKEGKKQTEERLHKALARVKSMVQYPEARDQYRRLLNVVSEMQETKSKYDRILNSPDETADINDDLIDLGALLDDDTVMSAET